MNDDTMQTDGPFVTDEGGIFEGGIFITSIGKWQAVTIRVPPAGALRLAQRIIAKHEELKSAAGGEGGE